MKTTPFTQKHIERGAKMHEFAGYNMPVEYSGIIDEHNTVVNNVGVFDVSHMGEIWIEGKSAYAFLQRVTSNDIEKLIPGKAQYSCLTNETGGIVDDLLVYKFNDTKYLLIVNASNTQKDYEWLLENNIEDVKIDNVSDEYAQLAIQGPDALKTIQKITNVNLSEIPYYSFKTGDIAGVNDVIISNTGYTGAGGFELYFPVTNADVIWNAIFKAGEEFGIKPIGLGARDTLRLEMGFTLYGNDINDETSPIEAGLGWITSFKDDKQFIGRDIIEKHKIKGTDKKLIAFKMIGKGIPRKDYLIVNSEGSEIGIVTSGTISPTLKIGIGMGYVLNAYSAIGTELFIRIRDKDISASVCKKPMR